MKLLDSIWEWAVALTFLLPLFFIGWFLGEVYMGLRAGYRWAEMRPRTGRWAS